LIVGEDTANPIIEVPGQTFKTVSYRRITLAVKHVLGFFLAHQPPPAHVLATSDQKHGAARKSFSDTVTSGVNKPPANGHQHGSVHATSSLKGASVLVEQLLSTSSALMASHIKAVAAEAAANKLKHQSDKEAGGSPKEKSSKMVYHDVKVEMQERKSIDLGIVQIGSSPGMDH
jgi:hypothetical protein